MDDPLLEKARKAAFRLLSVRGRSKKELRAKLHERGFSGETTQKIIDSLTELKYLDDDSFARDWARFQALHRLYGNRRIEETLREKGIDRESIKKAIGTAREEISEPEAIRIIIEKKRKGTKPLDLKEKRRLYNILFGRGFPPALIYEVLGRPQEGTDDDRE